jgi:hypothetical protein
VTAAIAASDEGDADDFTVDIDEPTQAGAKAPAKAAPAATPSSKAKAPDDDDFADFLLDIPVGEEEAVEDSASTHAVPLAATAPEPQPQAKAATAPAEKPEPKPEPAPEPGEHDDAIADFLLDIQIDDDE